MNSLILEAMKHLITILLICIFSSSMVYSQCEDLAFLYSLFDQGYAGVDEKLDSRGYTLHQTSDSTIVWINNSNGKNISATFDKEKTVQEVSYQLFADLTCYNDLKTKITEENYELDFEELSYLSKLPNMGGVNYYYKGEKYGALLIKGNLGDRTIYQFIILSLERYQEAIDIARET